MAKKDVFAPVDTDHPAFRSWFGKSVLHDNGVPRTYYHGTSKDADFKKFKMSRHGVWMTTDPEEASKYAIENDSQGFRRDGWDMKRVNTASRVIPVHARIEKPFVGEMPKEYLQENYKKSQSDWFDALRSNGYDGWVPKSQNGKLAVALGNPGQIKSALSNTGDYSETGDINKAEGGSVDNQSIGWSPARIERELNWSHYEDGRAKAHVAFVNPHDFLHSTTKTEASAKDIASAAGDLDEDQLSQSSQSPFLKVRDGKIVDHEGRHRMAALAAAGHKRVPVMVWHDQANKLAPIDRINLKAQHEGRPGLSVFDAVPLHRSHKSQIENMMVGADKRFAGGGSVDDQPQRDLSPLGLYSHAAEMASQLPQERGSPQQMAGILVNKYGVKPVEMEGFDEAFAGQPTVTRDQLVQHFKSKMPQIEETILGGKKAPEMDHAAKGQWIERYAAQSAYNSGDIENVRDWREASPEVLDWHRDIAQNKFDELMALDPDFADRFQSEGEGGKTKFQQYTLPGGENYREVLLKLPEGYHASKEALDDLASARQRFKELEKKHNDELEAGLTGEMTMSYEDFSKLTRERDIAKARVKNFEKIVNQPIFQSSHWEEPDVVAHLRMSDRTGLSGEKILHVEEIQSDWGQKGREEGFAKNLDPKILDQLGEEQSSAMFRLEDAREAFNNTYENIFKENLKSAFKDAPTEYDLQNALKMHDEVIKSNHPQKRFDEYKSNFLRMPDSFTPEQHSLLQDAYDAHLEARDAYNAAKDKMAEYRSSSKGVPAGPYVTKTADWTDLALKRALKEAADGGYDKLIWTPGEEQAKRYDLSKQVKNVYYDPELQGGTLAAEGLNGQTVLDKSGIKPEKIADYIGKEAAKKLLAQERNVNGHHVLEGDGLKVGGEGMKGYYDKIVPTQLQKLVKKLDPEAKIGKERINGPGGPIQEILDRAGITRDEWIELGDTGRDAIRKQYGTGPEFQSLEITPKMREAVKRGLPAFASGGAVDEDEDEGITAYHGSPYDFPKFDISKIGSGEGVQSYGHGLYFAESEPVARSYRDSLSRPYYKIGDEDVAKKYGPDVVSAIENVGGDPNELKETVKRLRTQVENNLRLIGVSDISKLRSAYDGDLASTTINSKKRADAIEELLNSNNLELAGQGHMYEVRIKAHPDHFLDWDTPLYKQPEFIQDAVKKSLNYAKENAANGPHSLSGMFVNSDRSTVQAHPDEYLEHDGAVIQNMLEKVLGSQGTSDMLAQHGVKGIKYYDYGSRNQKTGSRNYVVFNHDHVDIKRKYARGGAVDVG